ncbi:hypothetical protein CPJCM30710_00580 [Clostridium polyendosporum]|uniref:HPr kinase/phosphorylase n=1 Tax=Clostridium polyendosporum TaxID=69208 RepID=A0A919VER8_9CLOT|nr:hypothetical protein [Clostridium polyendosporum]GIM27392.1 hypothetical protein CPJCM30710_00580 [Clostridium polyendosporum]
MNIEKKNLKYHYRVYGLTVESEVLLSELMVAGENELEKIDVNINYGIMPDYIRDAVVQEENYRLKKNEMWFSIKEVANYYIYDGNSIIVEPCVDADPAQVKAFLLGSALGLLLIQRNIVAIHGGTILIHGQAVIFTGDTGAGKSTMTAVFRERGYYFMADDVSVIGEFKSFNHAIYPGYPQQKLCRDAIKLMGYDPDSFVKIDDDREKHIIPVRSSFVSEPCTLGAIFELSKWEGANVEIEEVTGSEKIITLMKNLYRIEATHFVGLNREYFRKCVEIAKDIPIYRIKRPNDKYTVDELVDIVLKAMDKKEDKSSVSYIGKGG